MLVLDSLKLLLPQMHISVLKNEIINEFDYLSNIKDGYFVDGTLGMAGHSLEVLKKYDNKNLKLIGIDKDDEALSYSKELLSKNNLSDRVILVHNDFSNITEILDALEIPKINGVLLDLGVSSLQLDKTSRGFSFQDPEAELDMRMNKTQELDAKYILNNYPSKRLAYIFEEYGEEKFAGNIAKNIAITRKVKHYEKISDLLKTLEESIPKKIIATSKKHYATNVFRALRMEVNDEVSRLQKTIEDFIEVLKPESKLAIITFHSIEDRIVKNEFKKLENPCVCPSEIPYCVCGNKPSIRIEKKFILPSNEEINSNPRSRSAKLRVISKI